LERMAPCQPPANTPKRSATAPCGWSLRPDSRPGSAPAGLRPLEAWPDPVDEPLKRLGPVGDQLLGCLPDPMMPPQHRSPRKTIIPLTQQATRALTALES
jgi:hypothetical protein